MSRAPHTRPLRVYYEDTDAGGVVYHAGYLRFMERGRTEWLRTLGFEQRRLAQEQGLLFTLRRMEIDFMMPARLDAELVVATRVQRLRPASIEFEQLVQDPQGNDLCRAIVLCACVEATRFRPTGIPQSIAEAISGGN
ncbi:MAG: tol-pal system-associated acyl-CoA thioesterase [Gammaproteobacteria bacterium]|nr:tol-pal system-associated acyl-CoA thioesterase [Gammaproteobacteria bacterium]